MGVDLSQIGRVGVLMGGVSSEREISLKSGSCITQALKRMSCDVMAIDIVDDHEDYLITKLSEFNIDLAFIALHGRFGEDGEVQSILDCAEIPYTGSGALASQRAFRKDLTQDILKKHEIPVPPFIIYKKDEVVDFETVNKVLDGFPVVVKPVSEGSSIGVNIARKEPELVLAIEEARKHDQNIIIEQFIDGRELTVGILGRQPLPVIEIFPKQPFFNYKAKYTKGETEYIVPADIGEELKSNLQDIALRTHQALDCRHMSRVDFMVDQDNNPFVLEINTIPGFTETSLLPKAAKEIGIGFDQLCVQLIKLAHAEKEKVKNSSSS